MNNNPQNRTLNIALTVSNTQSEGPGKRFAIWVQGCPLRCQDCCNPEMLDLIPKQQYTVSELTEIIFNTKEIQGLTFLGGEPLLQSAALAELATLAQAQQLSVMVFTGYTYQHIKKCHNPDWNSLLAQTDLLISGPFDTKQRSTKRRWIGSDNQEIHYLSERYHSLKTNPFAWDPKPNSIDIFYKDGRLTVNGFPTEKLSDWKIQLDN